AVTELVKNVCLPVNHRYSKGAVTMISWAWRLLPRNTICSFATSSKNQRAEEHHRQLEAYGYFLPIQTRWQDNDQYGHVNNVVYYSYFDTVINHFLIRYCGLETSLLTSPMVGFMVTNQCTYHTPIGFPQIPVAALAVEKVGHSSVHYRLALFPPKPTKEPTSVNHRDLTDGFFFGHPKLVQFDNLACTTGSAVHVFVNPASSKPEGLPEDFKSSLQKLMNPA
uniref:Thioesterase superfamily member 7 n=1 Tax=Nannospalax galili TaxID=1026970 RepID=A0A8C6REL5_NANGA